MQAAVSSLFRRSPGSSSMRQSVVRFAAFALLAMLGGNALAAEPVTLHAADQVTVYGTLSKARADNDKVLLLFHQASASRHEYDPLIARFRSEERRVGEE